MVFVSRSLSARLRNLTQELQKAEKGLKTEAAVEGAALREFRRALDNVRLTAWTVNELQNAQESGKDPHAVISFLTAERLRRFRQMIQDFAFDLEHEGAAWPQATINDLQESVNLLREQLGLVSFRRRS